MTNKQIIAVVQAAEEGKQIEERNVTRTGGWRLRDTHSWDFMCCEYRVQPTRREWWISEQVLSLAASSAACANYVHVREVLE